MMLLLKVTLLFGAGWVAALILAHKSAAARHLVWSLTLTGAVALAIASRLAPAVPVRMAGWPKAAQHVGVPAASTVVAQSPESAPVARVESTVRSTDVTTTQSGVRDGWDIGLLLGTAWLAGVLLVGGWYGLGHVRLWYLARGATPILHHAWRASLGAVASRAGMTAPIRLLRTGAVGSPITWGTRRPVVLLPADAESWPTERQRVVLAHELAHAVRADYLSQLVACAACAIYWFHPLVWIAARRLRVESERACDDQVLDRGISGVDYAAHLLDVARQSRRFRLGGAVAIGMARPSHLEGRLLAVLDPARPRRVPPRAVRQAGWTGLALIVLPLAVLTPVARESNRSGRDTGLPQPVNPQAGTPPFRAGEDSIFERSAAASPGERLELDLESGGGIDLRGWDRPVVQVRGRLGGANWEDTRVTLERTDGGVRLHTWQEVRRRTSATRHSFTIMVPRHFDVHISSAGGQVSLANVDGVFEGETGGGGFRIDRVTGVAHLSTGGGDVNVTDSDLRGRIDTGGGLVMLSRVRGGLKGSSGSGPVIQGDGTGVSGDLSRLRVDRAGIHVGETRDESARTGWLHIAKAGGSITLDAAPEGAEVSTGGGEVRVGRSSGFVEASTGGGDVSVGPVAGSVEASTGAGTVHVWISEAGKGDRLVQVFSGHGSVVLDLPPNLSARFELETAYTEQSPRKGRIESDWNLSQEETDRWDDTEGSPRKYVRATGSVGGGGPLIKVKIVNGDITVRRRNP
jgi:beta-lactamase regulating signal transducer with metallopeptidase domain